MEKPQEIKLLGLHLVQAKSRKQMTYTDDDGVVRRRRGLKYYTLYIDDQVEQGPNGILAPAILMNKTDTKALFSALDRGQIYLNAFDAEITSKLIE